MEYLKIDKIGITELILRGGVFSDVEAKTPQEVYKKITDLMKLPEGVEAAQVCKALCDREAVLSTAVGNGYALPHARASLMKNENEQRICVVYLKTPLEMKAPDDKPVDTMFILLTQNSQVHLKILASLAALFRESEFKKAIDDKVDVYTLCSVIHEIENKEEDK